MVLGMGLKEGEFTDKNHNLILSELNKDLNIHDYKIPLNIKKDLIINFIGISLLIFIFIFIPIEIILGHIHISKMPLLGLIGLIISFGFLFLIMIDLLRENLADYKFLKEHINWNKIDLEKKLEKINENLFNAISSKDNGIKNKASLSILGLMIILILALFLSIGKTEEGYWYMTEISTFIGGIFFILMMIFYIFIFRNESKTRFVHESVLIHKIILHKQRQIDL